MSTHTSLSQAGVLIGLGLVLTAGIIGFDAQQMVVPSVYAKVGPRVFPIIVACGLAIAGLLVIWRARAGDFPVAEGDTDWAAVAIISGGLVLHMNLLKPLGFIPASFILFLCVAYAFGSRRYLRDALIAAVMVTVTYLCFTKLLGLQLPPGILKGII